MAISHTKRADSEARFRAIAAKIQARGNRLTPQRVALLRILAESDGHPSAGELLERISEHFPTTSSATVYKTLALLKEIGEVFEIGFSDYDNRYDGNRPEPHPHLICVQCHEVIDAGGVDLDKASHHVLAAYAQQRGYRILSHRVDLLGVCPRCQEAAAPDESSAGGSATQEVVGDTEP